MSKGRVTDVYDAEQIRKRRTFPVANTVILAVLVLLQILAVILAARFEPKPQDRIQNYAVTVEPLADGSLDITYSYRWEALDTSEDLTWVELGMANPNYSVSTVSPNIKDFSKQEDGDYITLRLDFVNAYQGGDVLEFFVKVNQKDMLCKDVGGYFYEFVPGWFNATPVDNYEFRWLVGSSTGAKDAQAAGEYYTWNGSLNCGEYRKLFVRYGEDAFSGCQTADYQSFDGSGAYNELEDDKTAAWVMAVFAILVLLAFEVYIIDSYVSYHRGRGFLSGYGYHVHTYGRANPYYEQERQKHVARSGGSGRSGGCACACACACAGGGRAGCSQKDTYTFRRR